jgi:hypothetical protein
MLIVVVRVVAKVEAVACRPWPFVMQAVAIAVQRVALVRAMRRKAFVSKVHQHAVPMPIVGNHSASKTARCAKHTFPLVMVDNAQFDVLLFAVLASPPQACVPHDKINVPKIRIVVAPLALTKMQSAIS